MSRPKNSTQDSQSHEVTAVGLPIGVQGVDLRTSPRNRTPEALGELKNATFRDDKVCGRRPGHVGHEVRAIVDSIYKSQEGYGTTESSRWALGMGSLLTNSTDNPPVLIENSGNAYPRRAQGIFKREDETVVWTGDRLLAMPEAQPDGPWFGGTQTLNYDIRKNTGVPCILPAMESTVVATTAPPAVAPEAGYDGCLGRKYRLAAWSGTGVLGPIHISITDRETGVVAYELNLYGGSTSARNIRCVFSAGFLVVYWWDDLANLIYQAAAPESDVTAWSVSTEGTCQLGGFDVTYINEDLHLVCWGDGVNLRATYRSGRKERVDSFSEATVLATDAGPIGRAVAVAVHRNGHICALWEVDAGVDKGINCAVFQITGVMLGTVQSFSNLSSTDYPAVAVAARWSRDSDVKFEDSRFVGFCNADGGGDIRVRSRGITPTGVAFGSYRWHCALASGAFRVGDFVGAWYLAPYNLTFTTGAIVPTTTFLAVGLDERQQVCGWAEYGTTYNLSYALPSVRPDPREGTYGTPESPTTSAWHFVTAGRQRVSGPYSAYATVTSRTLEFLPKHLRSAQLGRSTYLAGAALQVYDGLTVTEVGFATPPSIAAFVPTTGGLLENTVIPVDNARLYRVYATWQNAQGEVCRSPAYTVQPATLAAPNTAFILSIRTIPCTNKRGVTFEVYRTENLGTTFYYVGQATQQNDTTAQYVTFTDNSAPDGVLLAASGRPVDPHNPAVGQASELEEVSPPGCAIVIAHQDRLWLAGGDLPAGQVNFSKLQELGEQAGFSDLVGSVLVAEDGAGITSLAGMNEGLVAFQPDKIRFLQGSGPDNLGNGFFPPAATIMGPGATTHEGTCPIDLGVVYWSDKGPQLLGTGLQVANISASVEPLAKTLDPSGVAAPNGLREVRWYTRDGVALLWDYQSGAPRWSVWSGLRVVGVSLRTAGRPDLAMTDGFIYRERVDAHTDGGRPFEFAFTTGELRPSELATGNNTLERVGVMGAYEGEHTLRVMVGFNGALQWDAACRFSWNPELDLGTTPIKDIPGALKDYVDPSTSPDGVYRFVRRIRRNPMSTVRLRFSDGGPPNASFVPHEVVLELGANDGVARVPVRRFDGRTTFEE